MLDMKCVVIYFAEKYNNEWEQIYYALENYEKIELGELEKIKDRLNMGDLRGTITIIDNNYPDKLMTIHKPPFVIFPNDDVEEIFKKKIELEKIELEKAQNKNTMN